MTRERLQYNTYHKQIFTLSMLIPDGTRVATHKGHFVCPRCKTDSEELPQWTPVACRKCGLTLQRMGDILEISDRYPVGRSPLLTTEPGESTSTPEPATADTAPADMPAPAVDTPAPKKGKGAQKP